MHTNVYYLWCWPRRWQFKSWIWRSSKKVGDNVWVRYCMHSLHIYNLLFLIPAQVNDKNKNWNFEFWFDEHYIMLIGSIINWLQKVWTFPSSYILISMKPNINDRCMKGLFGSHVKSILYWLEGQSISKNIYKKSQPWIKPHKNEHNYNYNTTNRHLLITKVWEENELRISDENSVKGK